MEDTFKRRKVGLKALSWAITFDGVQEITGPGYRRLCMKRREGSKDWALVGFLLARLAPNMPFAPFAQPEMHKIYRLWDIGENHENSFLEIGSAIPEKIFVWQNSEKYFASKVFDPRTVLQDLAVKLTVFEIFAKTENVSAFSETGSGNSEKSGSTKNGKIFWFESVFITFGQRSYLLSHRGDV